MSGPARVRDDRGAAPHGGVGVRIPSRPEERSAPMAFRGDIVIGLDSHIVERADRMYDGYIDPAFRDTYRQLCDGIAHQATAGHGYSLFGSRTSVVEPIETGRPLGVRDTFGLTRRSGMEGGRRGFPPGRPAGLPRIPRQ